MDRMLSVLKSIARLFAILFWFPAVMGALGLTVLAAVVGVLKAMTALAAGA
jgi:hypothetical protein